MARIKIRKALPTVDQIVRRYGLDEHGDAQRFLNDEVYRRMLRYMPHRTGVTETKLTKVISDTEIETAAVYARYLWYGVSRSGKPLNYTKTFNPLAGERWALRMADDELDAIAHDLQAFIDRKAGHSD
jgi:hypothetical protein